MFRHLLEWPKVSRFPEDILKFEGKSLLSFDAEWNEETGKPTIIGLSDGELSVSVPWHEGIPYFKEILQRNPAVSIVGHNMVGADLFVCEDEGIHLKLEQLEDSIIYHYLVNMHLCKTTKKDSEDEGERKGRGFMSLGAMSSIYTDLSYWKECRGIFCEGPCPSHDVHGYNGTDALAPVLALPALKRTAMLRGVAHLYPMHRELAYVLAEMSRFGVYVDVPYIKDLAEKFEAAKTELAKTLPFNPKSPKQVVGFFRGVGIHLKDAQEQTVRDAVEEYTQDTKIDTASVEVLSDLLQYQELGNGPDRWFAPVYRDKNGHLSGFLTPEGKIHSRTGYFTSSGRLMSSSPNLQNVSIRRLSRTVCECGHLIGRHVSVCNECPCEKFSGQNLGKQIRRAIIAPPGFYICRADYSNAENRVYLYLAGYEAPSTDLHNWMVSNIGLKESDDFSVRMGSARNASKSVTHAADYGEGLQLLTPAQLRSSRIVKEIDNGARLVFPDWTFNRKTVTFTGVNLARRAFGTATFENRRLALEITERYMGDGRGLGTWPTGAFPKIRDLQRRITHQIETEKMVRPPHGYALLSYGFDEDRIKTALAVWGSQPVAHISKLALIDLWRRFVNGRPLRPILQVHDELLAYADAAIERTISAAWLQESMELETPEMPGFIIPTDASTGPNWTDQVKVKVS